MRLRSSLLVLAALVVLPVSTAHAAARPALGCLRAGAPGELTLLEQQSSGGPIAHVFGGDATSVSSLTSTRLGVSGVCTDSASAGGVTAVAALSADRAGAEHVQVALRHGDGALAHPVDVTVLGSADVFASNVRVAVGPRGDVSVGWVQLAGSVFSPGDLRVSVMFARRAPGGDFGPPETVVTQPLEEGAFGIPAFAVGLDGEGTTTVLWSRPLPDDGDRDFGLAAVDTASAPAGQRLAPAQRVADAVPDLNAVSLAVGADGRALGVWTSASGATASERPAAAAAFVAPHTLADTGHTAAAVDEPSAALGPDGSALASWRITGRKQLAIDAAWHTAGQDFGTRRRVWSESAPVIGATDQVIDNIGTRQRSAPLSAAGSADGTTGSLGVGFFAEAGGQLPSDYIPPRALIGAGGKLTLTWLEVRPHDGDQVSTAWSATGTLANGFNPAQQASSDCRAAEGITPFTGASGPLVAWIDNSTAFDDTGYESATGDGRIHIQTADHVLPSVAPPIALKPEADPKTQRLYFDDPIKIAAGCDKPCDLRAWIPGYSGGAPAAATSAVLEHAGRVRIGLTATDYNSYPSKPQPITVRVRACDPSGIAIADKQVVVHVAGKPVARVVRLSDIHARRAGGRVVVTWRTDGPSARQSFVVLATKRRNALPDRLADTDIRLVNGSRKRTFRARVTGKDARYVSIFVTRRDPPQQERTYQVKVVSRP